MTDRELMQMALDAMIANAFDYEDDFGSPYNGERKVNEMRAKAAEALRARLAQPEPAECDGGQCGIGGYCKQCPKTQQEPTARDINKVILDSIHDSSEVVAPPKREWQGLTDEEILTNDVLRYHFGLNGGAGPVSKKGIAIIKAIEAKLKEKNHDS